MIFPTADQFSGYAADSILVPSIVHFLISIFRSNQTLPASSFRTDPTDPIHPVRYRLLTVCRENCLAWRDLLDSVRSKITEPKHAADAEGFVILPAQPGTMDKLRVNIA
jgi:hypothetical protein